MVGKQILRAKLQNWLLHTTSATITTESVSLFKFPQDTTRPIRSQWIRAINRVNADGSACKFVPSPYNC